MKQVIWNKKQVTVAALGAVVALTSFGAVQVSAAVNEAGTGGDTNVVYGVGSTAVGANSVALGKDANAEGANTGALGTGAHAAGAASVSIGANSLASGDNAVSIGTNSVSGSVGTNGQSTVAIGASAKATSNRAIAIGDSANTAWYGVAIGARVIANPTSVAIGGGYNAAEAAKTTMSHSVALGTYAKTTAAVDTAESTVTANGTSLKFTGFAGDGKANGEGFVVSIGTAGKEKQIQNVAAGRITATSTDAINGSQLYAVAGTMSTIAGSVKTILGGNADVADTGAITMTNIGGTNKNTVEEAIKAAKTEVAEGKNVTVTKTDGTAGQAIYTVAVKDDITLNSVTTGTTKIDANGLSIGDKNYVSADGLNANNQAIKNVGNGAVTADSTEAVNGAQLHTVDEKVTELGKKVAKVKNTAESLKAALGGTAEIKDDGSVTVTNIGGTGKDTLNEAIKAVKTEVKAGANVTVNESTGDNGQAIYTVSVNKDLAVDTVTTGATKVDTNGITIDNKQFVTKDGINANNTKVTNVANGTVSADSKDAVNGSQLHEVKESIESVINQKMGDINSNTEAINNKIDGINQTVNGLESRVNGRMDKAVAGAAALAALHPLDFDENDKWNIAAGYGNYRSGSALALGAFYRPNEDTMFSIGGAMGNGQNMVNVGVSLKLGQHNGVSNSRKAMAKEIDDLKAQLQAQDEKIAMLIQAMSNAR